MSRRDELGASLAALEDRLAAACAAAGRPRAAVTLVAVTKTWPLSDVEALADLGVRDVGENRDQEARAKALARPDLRWHFLGRLQTNKARSVAGYAALVHTVDRPEVVAALDAGSGRAGRVLDVLLQVSLDGDPARGGASPDDLPRLADDVAARPHLRLRGVMAVPPLGADPRPHHERVAALATALRAEHPGAEEVSAGMSADLEDAVAAGATIVRVGTALLGGRSPLRR